MHQQGSMFPTKINNKLHLFTWWKRLVNLYLTISVAQFLFQLYFYGSNKTETPHFVLHSRDNQLFRSETFAGSTAVTKTEDARKPKRKKTKKGNFNPATFLSLYLPQTQGKLIINDF